MTTKSWVIWIIVLVLVIGAGFGGYWYFFMRGKVSASEEADTTAAVNTTMTVQEGWNFVSFPYNTVTTVSAFLTAIGESSTAKVPIYRWSGSTWVNAEDDGVLKPGTGYLAYFSTGGTIDLGNNGENTYTEAKVPVVANQWQLVGKPILQTVRFRSSSSTSTDMVPYSGLSVEFTDGTTKTMLDAIAEGLVAAPLFMENSNPSYSYLKLYDLSGSTLPDFSAFWFLPKSDNITNIVFSGSGTAGDKSISRDTLESSDTTSTTTPTTP